MTASGTIRTALVFGLGVAALILGAAFFAPRLIDVRGFAPTIAAELSRTLGQQVQVRGDVFLSLVPTPRLIVRDIVTANDAGAAMSLRAPEAHASLSWRDLVLGRYTIDKVSLVGPDIKMHWRNAAAFGENLPRITVARGQLALLGLPSPVTITALEANVDISLAGTRSWTAAGLIDGLAFATEGRLTSPSRNGQRSLQADVSFPEADVSFEMSGMLFPSDHQFKAKVQLGALHAADVLALSRRLDISPSRWPWARAALAVAAEVTFTDAGWSFENGSVQLGENTAAFTATIDPDMASMLKVDIGNWDVAFFLPAGPAGDVSPAPRLLDRLFSGAIIGSSQISVNAPALRLGDQTLRDAVVQARAENGAWSVTSAGITLPGQTRVSFEGTWTAAAAAIDGTWQTVSADMHALLAWLRLDTSRLPPTRLLTVGASGSVQTAGPVVTLDHLNLNFDATAAQGRVSFALDGSVPVNLQLDLDRLAVDDYGPLLAAALVAAPAAQVSAQQGYGVSPIAPWLSDLASRRALVRLTVNQLTWRDALAGQFALDAALGGGEIDIRSLAFDDGLGSAVWLGGKIKSLAAIPEAEAVRFDVKLGDVPRMARTLDLDASSVLRALGPWSMTGAINGPLVQAAVIFDGKLGPVTVKSRGGVGFVDGVTKYQTTLELTHPDIVALRRAVFGEQAATQKISGAAAVSAALNVNGPEWAIENLTARLGPYAFKGDLRVNDTAGPRTVKAEISQINLDLSAFAAAPILPLIAPGAWQGEVALSGSLLKSAIFVASDFSARYVAERNAIELAEWTGKLFGGASQVGLKWTKEPDAAEPGRWAHLLQGQVVVTGGNPTAMMPSLGSVPGGGNADLTLSFSANAPHPADWLPSLKGDGSLRIVVPPNTALKSAGALAPLSAVVRAEAMNGRTTSSLEAMADFTITGGVFSSDAMTIKANAYNASFAGTADMVSETFDIKGALRLKDRGLIVGPTARLVLPPTVPMTITGSMQAPTIRMDTSGAQR